MPTAMLISSTGIANFNKQVLIGTIAFQARL